MPPVSLKPLYHRQQECIGIYYASLAAINKEVRKIAGIKWSQTNKCWYLPLDKDSYQFVVNALK